MKILEEIKQKFSDELITFQMLCSVKVCKDGIPRQTAFDPAIASRRLVDNMHEAFPNIKFAISKEKLLCSLENGISFDIDRDLNLYYHIWIGEGDFFVRYDAKRNLGFFGDDQIGFKTEDQKYEFIENLDEYKIKISSILK